MGARFALEQGARVGVTTSRRGTEARWAELARAAGVEINIREVDPGEAVVRARLSDPETGILSEPCEPGDRKVVPDMKIGFEVEVRESDKPGYEPTLRGVMLTRGAGRIRRTGRSLHAWVRSWPHDGVVRSVPSTGGKSEARGQVVRERDGRLTISSKGYRGHP